MRGWDVKSEALFSYVNCEARVPKDHPLRPIRRIVDEALGALSPEFEQLYAKFGRPSIPPERLLRALLLQAFYSVRWERGRENGSLMNGTVTGAPSQAWCLSSGLTS